MASRHILIDFMVVEISRYAHRKLLSLAELSVRYLDKRVRKHRDPTKVFSPGLEMIGDLIGEDEYIEDKLLDIETGQVMWLYFILMPQRKS